MEVRARDGDRELSRPVEIKQVFTQVKENIINAIGCNTPLYTLVENYQVLIFFLMGYKSRE